MELGHVVEVHAVDAGDEGEGDEDGGKDGEYLHHVVGFVADVGLEEVDLVGDHGVVDFDGFLGLEDEVVEVAEVGVGALVDDGGVAVGETGGDFLERADVFADVGEFGFEVVEFLHGAGLGGEDAFALVLDGGAEALEVDDVAVDEGVEEGVAEVVGTEGADAGFSLAEAFFHVVEVFAVGLLDGDEIVFADDHGDLFHVDTAVVVADVE